jgi:hypothetical protein
MPADDVRQLRFDMPVVGIIDEPHEAKAMLRHAFGRVVKLRGAREES